MKTRHLLFKIVFLPVALLVVLRLLRSKEDKYEERSMCEDCINYILENGDYLRSFGEYQKYLVTDEVVDISKIGTVGDSVLYRYRLAHLGTHSILRQSKFEEYKIGDKLNLIVTVRGSDIALLEPVAIDITDLEPV